MIRSAHILARGILLGLGAAVPIGPVNVELARRTLRGGFGSGFLLGCGAVSVDVMYAVLSAWSLPHVLGRKAVLVTLALAGSAFLLILSFLSIRAAVHDLRRDTILAAPLPASSHGTYFTGVFMTLLNPMTLAFWFLAVPAAAGTIALAADLPMICAGVFAGTIAWVITFAGVLSWAGRWRRKWWLAAADLCGGAVLFCFAVAGVWRVVRPVL